MLSVRLARPAIARPVAPRLRVRPAAKPERAQRAVAVRLSAKDLLGAKSGAKQGWEASEEANQLPVLQTAKDTELHTVDGRCLLVHSAMLEVQSPLLRAALAEDAKQRTPGEHLQLNIPKLSFGTLVNLVKVAYEELPYHSLSSIAAEQLYAMAEAAGLLQCSEILRLLDCSLVKLHPHTPNNALTIYMWASKHGSEQLLEQSTAYIADNIMEMQLRQNPAFVVPLLSRLQSVQQQQHGRLTQYASQLARLDAIVRNERDFSESYVKERIKESIATMKKI